MQELHPFLRAHSVADPETASIFYIPVYTAQHYHSLLLDQHLSHADSLNRTSEAVRRALTWVKQSFPYWNQTNGLNHFMVMPMDHGRCSSLAGLSHEDFGELFGIQTSGDQVLMDFETHTWPCYQPGRDIIVPSHTEAKFTLADIVKPNATDRAISALYRFVGGGRGEYGVLRTQLLDREQQDPIPGSVTGWNTVDGTHEDMKHSKFCVCPPGIAQQTLRVWRAIMFGCIPITLFHANDAPYQRFSHLDYSTFSLNINPNEWHLLQVVVRGLLARPDRIAQLQEGLAEVQSMFLWDSSVHDGAFKAVLHELSLHPAQYVAITLHT